MYYEQLCLLIRGYIARTQGLQESQPCLSARWLPGSPASHWHRQIRPLVTLFYSPMKPSQLISTNPSSKECLFGRLLHSCVEQYCLGKHNFELLFYLYQHRASSLARVDSCVRCPPQRLQAGESCKMHGEAELTVFLRLKDFGCLTWQGWPEPVPDQQSGSGRQLHRHAAAGHQ